jgi:hypothetical protein
VPRDSRRACTHRERAERVENGDAVLVLLADLEESFLFSSASREGGAQEGWLVLQRRSVGVK